MIKQSKLSKICWALVYLLPLIFAIIAFWFDAPRFNEDGFFYSINVFEDFDFPIFELHLFSANPLRPLFLSDTSALFADRYLGYLVLVSLFRIVWRVLVYLPDVVGKLIDRWSL